MDKITEEEPNLTIQPHHLTDDEAALIAEHIKRLKRNDRRRQLYAERKISVTKVIDNQAVAA